MGALAMLRRGLSLPYECVMAWRAAAYRGGVFRSEQLSVPVVSVGNLTFGGTGKTPTVAWLAAQLLGRGIKVGILSRGYGAGAYGGEGSVNDEGRMLAAKLPQVPQVQNPDRLAGGRALIEKWGSEAILLDDGFQHLRLRRDLDLLLVDATDPFGGGGCPPGGRLREGIAASRRADLILLTRADLATPAERESIWTKLHAVRSDWPRVELAFRPSAILETASGKSLPLASASGRTVVLLSAIGNPAAFRKTVESAGLRVEREFRFRDHHRYTNAELDRVFREAGNAPVLTTAKDWAKIQDFSAFPPWVLEIETQFLRGKEFLEKKLDELFPARASR